MLTEPTIPIELNTYSERSEARDHARGSNHPPCYGAPIWLKRLIWLYCFLSILVFVVRLPMVHERKQDLQTMCSDTYTPKEKEREVTFSRKLRIIMMCRHKAALQTLSKALLKFTKIW